jgi:hypothetical protein
MYCVFENGNYNWCVYKITNCKRVLRMEISCMNFYTFIQWRGPLGIFGVGTPVDCCHCLTEILNLY